MVSFTLLNEVTEHCGQMGQFWSGGPNNTAIAPTQSSLLSHAEQGRVHSRSKRQVYSQISFAMGGPIVVFTPEWSKIRPKVREELKRMNAVVKQDVELASSGLFDLITLLLL